MKKFWLSLLFRDVRRGLWGIFIAFICAFIIAGILYPFGYRADPQASLFKILDHLLVFQKLERSPRVSLFSQYPKEYNLAHPNGWISNDEVLEISENKKPLWLAILNSEPRTLHNLRFILFPPNDVSASNEGVWIKAWQKAAFLGQPTQYDYLFPSISPRLGLAIPYPIQFEFPGLKDYRFTYAITCDDYAPLKGSFIIRRSR